MLICVFFLVKKISINFDQKQTILYCIELTLLLYLNLENTLLLP